MDVVLAEQPAILGGAAPVRLRIAPAVQQISALAAAAAASRLTNAPRANDVPSTRPVAGAIVTRPVICLPELSSETRGFESVPVVTAAVASMARQPVVICTPVSHVKALTSGTPRAGAGLPTE